MAGMWEQGGVVRMTEEGRGLVGLDNKLGNYAHCTGEYGSLRPLCGDWSIGGHEWKWVPLGVCWHHSQTRMVAVGVMKCG